MAEFKQYAPEFSIRIAGEPIPAAMRGCVTSISYEDGIEGADRVEIVLANPSLQWLDHPLLQAGNDFEFSLGYAPGPLDDAFFGEITGIEPMFPSGAMPTMRITAQDYLNRLGRGTKDRGFRISIPSIGNFPLPDPAVAAIVSAGNALVPALDPVGAVLSTLLSLSTFISMPQTAQKAVRHQTKTSDYDFLRNIAKENGWEMYIDHTLSPRGRVLRFQFVIQDYSPSQTLEWGSSLMDFTPRLTTVGDLFGISTRVWVDSIGMEFVIIVSWDYDRAALNLMVYPSMVGEIDDILGPEAGGKTLSVQSTGYSTAPRKILSELLPRLNNRLTGSGSAVGNPEIKAGRVIELKGLGSEFSGLYRVTSATHSIDSGGYRTRFQARKEVWFGSVPVPKRPAMSSLLTGQFAL
jgi:hypothetical protein